MCTFESAVNDNYDRIKTKLKSCKIYDDDIFHDTILSCYNVFKCKDIHPDRVERYFWTAYKMNILRSKKYYWAKNVNLIIWDESCSGMMDVEDGEYQNNVELDYTNIKDYMMATYGEEVINLMKRYNLGGYSIQELEKESGVKGLRYKFQKITADVQRKFQDLFDSV